jgi:hypothetical protein
VRNTRPRDARSVCAASSSVGPSGQRAVQDHEGDRRERQQLRERDPGQAVDPARPGHAEPGIQPAGDETGAPEQHDDRERDHERGRDDRQHRHELQQPRIALTAALHEQRESEPQQRRQHADDRREQCGVDGHAAARASSEAADAPDIVGEQARRDERRREMALPILDRGERLADGKKMKIASSAVMTTTSVATVASAPKSPCRANARRRHR